MEGVIIPRVSSASCSVLYFDCCDIFIGGNHSLIVFSHTVTQSPSPFITTILHVRLCLYTVQVPISIYECSCFVSFTNNLVLVRALFFFFFFFSCREVIIIYFMHLLRTRIFLFPEILGECLSLFFYIGTHIINWAMKLNRVSIYIYSEHLRSIYTFCCAIIFKLHVYLLAILCTFYTSIPTKTILQFNYMVYL